MKRRELILASGAWIALTAAHARAQPAQALRRIAWLSASAPETQTANLAGFRAKLKDLGYVEGRDFAIDFRWAGGRPERLPAFARELIALKPAVVVAGDRRPSGC